MLRQRSSEVMYRTFYRPPYYALHVGLRGVGADGWRKSHCEHGESVNRRGMQVRRKETAKIERRRLYIQ